MAINVNNCTVSEFISETVCETGFSGFAKPISDLQIKCIKPPNPKPVLVRFWQIKYVLNQPFTVMCHPANEAENEGLAPVMRMMYIVQWC